MRTSPFLFVLAIQACLAQRNALESIPGGYLTVKTTKGSGQLAIYSETDVNSPARV